MPSTATEKWEQTASKPRSTSTVQTAEDHLTFGGRCCLGLFCRSNLHNFLGVHSGVNVNESTSAPFYFLHKM